MADTKNPAQTAEEAESGSGGGRGPDEIALELMKFVAVATGYGKAGQFGQSAAGFSGKPATKSAEEHAEALLELFKRCRKVVKEG